MKLAIILGVNIALLARSAYARDPYYDHDFDGSLWDGPDDNGGNGEGYIYGGSSSSGYAPNTYDSFAGFDIQEVMRDRTAHGVIAALCFVILFPVGAVLVRIVPSRLSWVIHAVTQSVAFILFIVAAALGIRMVDIVDIPPNSSSLLQISSANAHPIIGLVLLVVMFIQPVLGYIHHSWFKRLQRRTTPSYVHIWLGRAAITLGIINGGLGLQLANASQDVIIAYSVIAAVAWLVWLASAIYGEVRRRQNIPNRDTETRSGFTSPSLAPPPTGPRGGVFRHHNSSPDDPSPPYTPGVLYGGPPVYRGTVEGDAMEMEPAKDPLERSNSSFSVSPRTTETDVTRRL